MQRTTRPPPSYPWLLRALAPVLAGYTAWRAGRRAGPRYLRERLGLVPPTAPGAVWVHAASVGEVVTARPLLAALAAGGRRIVLTTHTETGAAVAARAGIPGLAHRYLPLDLPGAVGRFLDRTRPACGLVVETELWPTLLTAAARRGIPVAIVNGRVSHRSLRGGRYHRRLAAAALGAVTAVLARSAADAEGFRTLGAPPERVRVIGNLKFAPPPQAAAPARPLPGPFVLAASTHEDEERRIGALWAGRRRGQALVIAPRHPERAGAVAAALAALGLAVRRRSRGETVAGGAREVFLLDTVGELEPYLAHAEVVIMGGSFVPRGGHNLLEPARHGRAVVVGPHMENFAEETDRLLAAEAIVRVADEAALGPVLDALLADEARRRALGRRARAVLEAEADVVARYLDALADCGVLPAR
ncbi:3-deoxy-D-manno-octulosonic acid transferase [Inmirania thermothiophila]|uniref:3-deoxy-D-manno-octulosonic acid transferase n=1 Tax=Inmirania thermothiophila TaxID=1750597 RepID=A0A3N1YAU7_9GAMM|nr:glycosyltransferase N-terminal domain-containing protein [Inmirania thermothiophila]ROR34752.1 3-deoxy-D-manno-octulosonic-acid transferase [Inmirania thermothiophila]